MPKRDLKYWIVRFGATLLACLTTHKLTSSNGMFAVTERQFVCILMAIFGTECLVLVVEQLMSTYRSES